MQDKSNPAESPESKRIQLAESVLSNVILWTLFLPIKLAFLTIKSDKHKVLLIFVTVFVAYAYMLSFIQIYDYANDAIEFKHDVLASMIFDRVDTLDSEAISSPTQNIPDVFSYTLVDEAVAIYHPDALSPNWIENYKDAESILSTMKYNSILFVTSNGTKFHLEGCRHLNGGGKEIIYQNALMHGYEPCKVCFSN